MDGKSYADSGGGGKPTIEQKLDHYINGDREVEALENKLKHHIYGERQRLGERATVLQTYGASLLESGVLRRTPRPLSAPALWSSSASRTGSTGS